MLGASSLNQPSQKRSFPGSMRRALLLVALVAILPLLLVQAGIYWSWFYSQEDEERQANLEVAQGVAATFANYVRDVHRQGLALGSALVELVPYSTEQANRFLSISDVEYSSVCCWSWTDPQGKIIASSDPAATGKTIDSGSSYFREILSGRQWAISDLCEGESREQPTFFIARRIEDKDKTLKGIMVAEVLANELGEFALRVHRIEEGTFALFDRQGTLVYMNPAVPGLRRHWREADPLLDAILRDSQERTGVRVLPIDAQTRIVARAPVRDVGWVAGASRPRTVVMSQVYKGLWLAAGLNLVFIAISLAGAATVSRQIISRLRRLQEHAQAVGRGDFGHRTEITGITELAELAVAFNQMGANLKQAREEQQRANLILEQRVEERTAELRAANQALKQEIAQRKEAQRRDDFTKALLELFATKTSRKDYLDSVVDVIRSWSGCRCLGIRVVDKQANIPYESYVGFSREFWELENRLSLKRDSCACIRVVLGTPEPQDAPVMTPGGSFRCDNAIRFVDQLSPELQARYRGNCVRSGFASIAVIPIRYHGQTLGAIHLADQRENMVPQASIEFIESMAPLIGEAIHRFNMEAELRAASSYARGLIEASLDPLVTISPQGQITDVNQATELVTGVPREQLIGSDFSHYFTQPQKASAGYQQVLSEGLVKDYPLTIRHPSGSTTDVLYNAVVYRNEAGQVQGVFAAARDVTERKRAEEELNKYRAHLEELVAQRTDELARANQQLHTEIAERKQAAEILRRTAEELARSNSELEQFAYVASHDLQEPMRVITGYLQLIERRYKNKLDADAEQFIDYVVDAVQRMQQLISDLLEYSRVGSRGKPFGPTDTQAVLDKTLAGLQNIVQETGALITHDPLPTVQADQTQLIQLFQNLIVNAIKFRSDRRPEIHVSARPEDGRWLFSVRDNGIGIEKEYWDRIFVIFQRLHTRQKYSGTGIGLAICKRVVERHGGRIWLDSRPGQGTTFYFTL